MVVKYYYSGTTGSTELKKQQQRIEMILTSKKIQFEWIDVAASEEDKDKMRELMGDPKGLPPQLFNDETYLGGYEQFDAAVEAEELENFLKL